MEHQLDATITVNLNSSVRAETKLGEQIVQNILSKS
jgi:hypothetical protein